VVSHKSEAPNRGDIAWISLSPQAGHEQAGRRPAIVLSPLEYNAKVGLAICCPVTSQAKGYPFEVQLPLGLPVSGVVLADQVKCLDWRQRGADVVCAVEPRTVSEVLAKLGVLLKSE
jgi:mRNA interferase MazF